MEEDKNNPSNTPDEQQDAAAQDEVVTNDASAEAPAEDVQQDAAGDVQAEASTDDQPAADAKTEEKPPESKDDGKKKPKTVWYGIIAAFVVLAGTVGLILTLTGDDDSTEPVASQTEQQPQAPVTTLGAEVAIAEGEVEISNDGGTTWTGTEGSDSVANLDYVRTLDDSRAVILFDDGSVARLDNNTEVYLSSLERDGLEMTLVKGQVYTRVVESEATPFTVVTANERFTSLGTAYKTSTDGEKDELEVYQSNVKVTSEDVEVTEGNKYDTESKEQSAIDLEELENDDFAQWNKEKDSENDDFKDSLGVLAEKPKEESDEPQSQQPSSSSEESGISLSAKQFDSGVSLSWTLSGVSSSNGFKVVRDTSSSPTYGQDDAQYVSKSASSYKWWDDNGGTYYYRVCIYRDNGTCDTYSNAVKATSPKVEKASIESGDISLSIDGNKITWSLVGGTAPHGFKVVLSEEEGPEYPENSIQYVGAESTSATLPEKSAGTYYVRVCKYTNGTEDEGCVDYSNEVEYVTE